MTGTITYEGSKLVDDWKNANVALERARNDETNARNYADRAKQALIKWLLPPDAAVGEKIAIWCVDLLIQVEVVSLHPLEGRLSIRPRAK